MTTFDKALQRSTQHIVCSVVVLDEMLQYFDVMLHIFDETLHIFDEFLQCFVRFYSVLWNITVVWWIMAVVFEILQCFVKFCGVFVTRVKWLVMSHNSYISPDSLIQTHIDGWWRGQNWLFWLETNPPLSSYPRWATVIHEEADFTDF